MKTRYKLIFEYDGTDFNGWQKQPSGRTVEEEIEKAFSQLFQFNVDIIGQGRTDAGVHALAQVAHVDLPEVFSPGKIIHAMKGMLPPDVAMHSVIAVEPDFHARFDAVARCYRYNISTKKSPLHRRFSWELSKEPDFELLQKMAVQVTGTHNFINFCVPSDNDFQTTLCSITESTWKLKGERLTYFIEGNRFLRHMVRRLTGCMIKAATGRISENEFALLLQGTEKRDKAFSAPAHGLVLTAVLY